MLFTGLHDMQETLSISAQKLRQYEGPQTGLSLFFLLVQVADELGHTMRPVIN